MSKFLHTTSVLLLGILCFASMPGKASNYPIPERIARLSVVQGDVSMAPNGSDDWFLARRNRTLLGGDRLYTDNDSRAVLQTAGSALRLDQYSSVALEVLSEDRVQIRVAQGTVNLAVRHMPPGMLYEIDTPTLAFVADRPGSYRIDIDPDGNGAMVTVLEGSGTVWGADNERLQARRGRSYRFDSPYVQSARIASIPRFNDFDRFCEQLDDRYARSRSARYVASNVIGYTDLDRYGSWQSSSTYGHIWFPNDVGHDWAPYRHGRWDWIEPWGWTWVDSAPWGFAPFHYGRWARVHNRWGWIPGPRSRRAVYAPALVAFVGNVRVSIGGAAPVAWFPLGPRDIYRPWYDVDERYFININLGGGHFFHHNRMRRHWRDFHHHRRHDWKYAYRHDRHAVTAVSRKRFRASGLVSRSGAQLSEAVLRQSTVSLAPTVQPNRSRSGHLSRKQPSREVFDRPVVRRAALRSPNAAAGLAHSPRGTPRQASAISRSNSQPDRNISVPSRSSRPSATVERQRSTPRGTPVSRPRGTSTETPLSKRPQSQSRPAPRPVERAAPRSRPTVQPSRKAVSRPVLKQPVRDSRRTEPRSRPQSETRTIRRTPSAVAPRPRSTERSTPRGQPRSSHPAVQRPTHQSKKQSRDATPRSTVRKKPSAARPVRNNRAATAAPRGRPQR